MWTGPSGERPLLPKDEGSGLMISSLICREHGLIRELDINLLTQVNHSRIHSKYADEEAAIDVRLSLTMDLLLSKINTKGKNKRELVEICTRMPLKP